MKIQFNDEKELEFFNKLMCDKMVVLDAIDEVEFEGVYTCDFGDLIDNYDLLQISEDKTMLLPVHEEEFDIVENDPKPSVDVDEVVDKIIDGLLFRLGKDWC